MPVSLTDPAKPYIGGGIGAAIPHVESTIGGLHFEQYQLRGPAYQALSGLNFDLARRLSIFTEYKLAYVDLDRLRIPNGCISLSPITQHLVTGIAFRFQKRRALW